ncbi:MAG: hypothetical protein E6593_16965 [Clostridium sp.]|nr:hypothetical protein [Clostridium sp.]
MISGYKGIGPESGRYVSAEDAPAYAMERCGVRLSGLPGDTQEEFLLMLEEWFFSGDWVPDKQGEEADSWAS